MSSVLTRWLRQGLRYGICPVCRAHHKLDREYIWGFFDQWSMQDTAVEQFAAGSGLCVPRFRQAWDAAQSTEQRGYLQLIQHTTAARLVHELREHARKQRAEAAGEPAGPEADSWQRAIWMTSGWPAPTRAASVPEGDSPYTHPPAAEKPAAPGAP